METIDINWGNFDWFDVLQDLVDGGKCSEDDGVRLRNKAGDWVTCACGQLCRLLPRAGNAPRDQRLNELGLQFAQMIGAGNWTRALDVLNEIEKRSAQCLKDMGVPVIMIDHPRRFQKVEPKPFAVSLAEKGCRQQQTIESKQ